MITLFHGDDQVASRNAFTEFLGQFCDNDLYRFSSKDVNIDQITGFLQGGSLLANPKAIACDNFFSLAKANLDKILPLINHSQITVILWQDKLLNASQLKSVSSAKVSVFKADNKLYGCLNALKPHNLTNFNRLYDQVISQDLFDLFLYLLKGNLRRQLLSSSRFDTEVVKKIYLRLVELEFQHKTGQLSLPREIALKRVLLPLVR